MLKMRRAGCVCMRTSAWERVWMFKLRGCAAGLHDEAPCDQAGLDIARPQTGSAGEGTHYRAAGLHEGKCGQAGLDTTRPRTRSAGEQLSTAGPGPEQQLCGAGLRTTRRRRKRRTLRKSRSGTETHQEQSAGQTEAVTPDVETLSVLTRTDTGFQYQEKELANPPTRASELTSLPAMSWKRFTRDLHDGCIEQVCVLSDSERTESESEELRQLFMGSTTESEDTLSAKTKRERFKEQGWDSLKSSPYYELLREYKDVLPEEIPAELPQDKGIQHEIDLVPGTKYCVTRQWPLPRDQVKAIDDFFESRRKAGQVRESKSPHSAPTFCVKKPQGGWRIVHAYNKLNDATVPAQTPIPRKDVIIDSMAWSTVYSALDLRDGFYQILMRESDIPLTAVSTPSGMLWEWLVMPQGLKNAPATFNRCVTHLLRSVRVFAPSYFDDLFIHSRAVDGKTDVEMHRVHLRKLLELMRKHKLYANLKKCIFGESEIPVLGCLVGKNGVRPDPEKVRVINEWSTPSSVKELRQFLGLATYLCKYVEDYAGKIRPLSQLLKKEAVWNWTTDCQKAFDAVKQGLTEAPILAVSDQDRPFHVVCDASDFAIGCALMQHDHEGRDRVVYYQSRQLKAAERNYPVHDKELLAMKYALAKFRVYLLGSRPFVVYTDHASLRTAVKSPHISQRMVRWLSFFAEYNFRVEYKPGRLNVVADALSRRPDYAETADVNAIDVMRSSKPISSLLDDVKAAYAHDADTKLLLAYGTAPSDKSRQKLPKHLRARAHRFRVHDGLLLYNAVDDNADRVVVPNDHDLRLRIMYEYHDALSAGHLGREKTYVLLTRDLYWHHQYKWVRKYVRACEVCQRVKPAPFAQAPLQSLPTPSECWKSMSLDFIFGLPPDSGGNTGVVVFVDRFSKMVHLAAVPAEVTAKQTARLFVDMVFKHHGMQTDIVSDRDPRFTANLWQEVFTLLGSQLLMSTADHPQTDGQTERVNRVLVDTLKSYAHSFQYWSECLSMAEFAINNSSTRKKPSKLGVQLALQKILSLQEKKARSETPAPIGLRIAPPPEIADQAVPAPSETSDEVTTRALTTLASAAVDQAATPSPSQRRAAGNHSPGGASADSDDDDDEEEAQYHLVSFTPRVARSRSPAESSARGASLFGSPDDDGATIASDDESDDDQPKLSCYGGSIMSSDSGDDLN
ncbi:reverse transcriptase [Phytophthora cinnamomi]|uniref:reverse transcriptase n=1 Tax=Phytophthora cinnamomi TaxID=4785 RepID=UPI00355A340F|nr:reverse transcriptase [Phytophthora cinnamomi]